jgi:DNA-binding response OmpR family regulator
MATKLLLVEDNSTIQKIVEAAFANDTFDVVIASDAADGLHKLNTLLPDIVLADASMPGLSGVQLCQIIRGTTSMQHVPVVLLTSTFTTYDQTQGEQVGVTAHLTKPFEPQELLALVQRLAVESAQEPSAANSTTPMVSATSALSTEASDIEQSALPSRDPGTIYRPQRDAVEHGAQGTHSPRPSEAPSTQQGASPQHTAVSVTPSTELPDPYNLLPQLLGQHVLQMFQAACQIQLATMLEALQPQLLAAIREVVAAKVPELLELLLQREIDQLKRAAEHEVLQQNSNPT